jgi:hypothetical protein
MSKSVWFAFLAMAAGLKSQTISPVVIGHEYRQDDLPSLAAAPDGSLWAAWLSFAGDRDVGVIASSDHSSTHISYAMVYTDDPTRQGILDAIRKRHTYGAMDNIIVDVRMGNHFMGNEFSLGGAVPLHVKLAGTGPIATVAVIRDGAVIYSVQPNQQTVDFDFKDTTAPAGQHYYYLRLQQQNQLMAWSSPMFVTYRGGVR